MREIHSTYLSGITVQYTQLYNTQHTAVQYTAHSCTIHSTQLYNTQLYNTQHTAVQYTAHSCTIHSTQLYNIQHTAVQYTAHSCTVYSTQHTAPPTCPSCPACSVDVFSRVRARFHVDDESTLRHVHSPGRYVRRNQNLKITISEVLHNFYTIVFRNLVKCTDQPKFKLRKYFIILMIPFWKFIISVFKKSQKSLSWHSQKTKTHISMNELGSVSPLSDQLCEFTAVILVPNKDHGAAGVVLWQHPLQGPLEHPPL